MVSQEYFSPQSSQSAALGHAGMSPAQGLREGWRRGKARRTCPAPGPQRAAPRPHPSQGDKPERAGGHAGTARGGRRVQGRAYRGAPRPGLAALSPARWSLPRPQPAASHTHPRHHVLPSCVGAPPQVAQGRAVGGPPVPLGPRLAVLSGSPCWGAQDEKPSPSAALAQAGPTPP